MNITKNRVNIHFKVAQKIKKEQILLSPFYETSVILILKPFVNNTNKTLLSFSFMTRDMIILGKILAKQI